MKASDDMLSVSAAAERLGVSRWTIWRMIADGDLDAEYVQRGSRLFTRVMLPGDGALSADAAPRTRWNRLQDRVDRLTQSVECLSAMLLEVERERAEMRMALERARFAIDEPVTDAVSHQWIDATPAAAAFDGPTHSALERPMMDQADTGAWWMDVPADDEPPTRASMHAESTPSVAVHASSVDPSPADVLVAEEALTMPHAAAPEPRASAGETGASGEAEARGVTPRLVAQPDAGAHGDADEPEALSPPPPAQPEPAPPRSAERQEPIEAWVTARQSPASPAPPERAPARQPAPFTYPDGAGVDETPRWPAPAPETLTAWPAPQPGTSWLSQHGQAREPAYHATQPARAPHDGTRASHQPTHASAGWQAEWQSQAACAADGYTATHAADDPFPRGITARPNPMTHPASAFRRGVGVSGEDLMAPVRHLFKREERRRSWWQRLPVARS